MRHNKLGLAMKLAAPLAKEVTEAIEYHKANQGNAVSQENATRTEGSAKTGKGETAGVALAMIEYVDDNILAPQFDYVDSLFEGQDVALAQSELKRFSTSVKGVRKYEVDVDRMLDELSKDTYAERMRAGKRFYALKAAASRGGNLASVIKNWERFKEACHDEYYRNQAQITIEELRKADAFNKQWGDKDESAR